MGFRGTGTSRAFCDRPGCGRRGYVDDGTRFLCHVCHHDRKTHETRSVLKEVRGSPARQSRTPLQVILHNPALVQLCMEMMHEEDDWAWELQCPCTRCERRWLNRGWVCPVEHHRELYLRLLDAIFHSEGFRSAELTYVDWDWAVLQMHEMHTYVIPWSLPLPALRAIARSSADRVLRELRCTGSGTVRTSSGEGGGRDPVGMSAW